MLFLHIFRFQLQEGAMPSAHAHRLGRFERMHMHLDDIIVTHADDRVADGRQLFPHAVLIKVTRAAWGKTDDEFCAESIFLSFHGSPGLLHAGG